MHEMEITKIEFLADRHAIITFYCPTCMAIIELNTQDESVNVRVEGETEVRHIGD
jgi:hypothetical protein